VERAKMIGLGEDLEQYQYTVQKVFVAEIIKVANFEVP